MTTISTEQVIDHLFLLTLLSSKRAERGKLFDKLMDTVASQPDKEKTYQVEVSVNGIVLDFNDFTAKVNAQLDEMVMSAARSLLDEQFADRFREISVKLNDAERHAEDLRNALEAEVRRVWGIPLRQDEGD